MCPIFAGYVAEVLAPSWRQTLFNWKPNLGDGSEVSSATSPADDLHLIVFAKYTKC